MRKKGAKQREEMSYEEAEELSQGRGSALEGLLSTDSDDLDLFLEEDPDVADLNNPDVESLAEPPLLGARPKPVDLGFGEMADTFGRATSPKLYASAAQFPTAVQFRVWRWENGVPVGLGAIDAEATEEDFVRAFFDAMPRPGQGNYQFRMRPIDIRGQELGKEFTINISEHHATLRQMREAKKREEEEKMSGGLGGLGGTGWGRNAHAGAGAGGDIIVNSPAPAFDAGASYAEEMGRMFEQAVESAEQQNRVLRDSLEMERERLREEEKTRADERVSMAQRSAETVEKMMERLMSSDRSRSQEQMKAAQDHSSFMMQTLTQVFAQQQEASRQQSERMREQDQLKISQDREFFERQRQEMELRRQREREEAEEKRRVERDEFERRRRQEQEDWERRRNEERERLQLEQRRWEESRRQEVEQARLEAQRREAELERRRESEREEARLRIERERMELEERRAQLQAEREQARMELEERRRQEQMEFERKMQIEREDRERKERIERERWERERQEAERKREEERREWERREALRREEMQREAERRREEMALQLKQLEMSAQKDREHSERMTEMARLEREAQREAALQREKAEREAREQAERERQRQFDLQKFEMEQAKERDREHAERMLQMTKYQSSGGLSGITDMLGMDTPEVLAKIFGGGGGGESSGGWADAIPKVLSAVAEVGTKAMSQGAGAAPQVQGRRPVPQQGGQQMVAVQTPEGVRMIPVDALAQLQAARGVAGIPVPQPSPVPVDLPTRGFEPSGVQEELETEHPVPSRQEVDLPEASPEEEEEATGLSPQLEAAMQVDPIKRAKASGMPFSKQRAARRAIRKLMPALEKASSDEWMGVVAGALMEEPAIYDYLKTVSVYVALVESGTSPETAEKTVREMKNSGMIPDEVPYDEEDFARLQKEAEEA